MEYFRIKGKYWRTQFPADWGQVLSEIMEKEIVFVNKLKTKKVDPLPEVQIFKPECACVKLVVWEKFHRKKLPGTTLVVCLLLDNLAYQCFPEYSFTIIKRLGFSKITCS